MYKKIIVIILCLYLFNAQDMKAEEIEVKDKEIILMFPVVNEKEPPVDVSIEKIGYEDKMNPYMVSVPLHRFWPNETGLKIAHNVAGFLPVNLKDLVSMFEEQNFSIEIIEVWIQARIGSGNILKLFLSVDGQSGVKVVLKPN